MKRLLSGNEAIALGAWEAGVRFASAYPGTPSTEILEALAQYAGVRAEWASNEKVALDAAAGAAFGGTRALAAMKHVGVNVAADSLMSLSYTGIKGGLVVVSADDPGAFSSQNEQDNRHYARFGKFPCLEPADSEEARQFTRLAFDLSEQFQCPVMVRSTTRLSHSKSQVEVEMPEGPRALEPLPPFERHPEHYVIIPANARRRHPVIEQRLLDIAEWAETAPVNRIEWGDRSLGIITCGMAYQYAREVFEGFSILKLGMTHPLPRQMIRDFAAQVERLVVMEELDPFIEGQVRAMGIPVIGKEFFPLVGEFTPAKVREAALAAGLPVGNPKPEVERTGRRSSDVEIPARPPALCPGCPHRAFFYNLRRWKRQAVFSGDIGCYSMGVLPPFEVMDMLISMGASVGMAHGLKRAGAQGKVIAIIGDSTFFHSGLSPLANAVYNQGNIVVAVLDNRITAMTGGQQHPGTGITLQGEEGRPIEIAPVARAMGVEQVWEVDAWDVKAINQALKEAMAVEEGPAVVVVKGACVFTPYYQRRPAVAVDAETCTACGTCFRVGCPAILKSEIVDPKTEKPKATIDPLLCTGCTVCLQVCPAEAIYETGGKEPGR
ncbi:MAG TPA: indolepyruvate ferredoxin oxidoreductase subunit alpha [Chloroflexi bacterium]|nr:indolepyruvate ferredoxin oxidoreductase subunit alpha [Chloroflexota bacterium]